MAFDFYKSGRRLSARKQITVILPRVFQTGAGLSDIITSDPAILCECTILSVIVILLVFFYPLICKHLSGLQSKVIGPAAKRALSLQLFSGSAKRIPRTINLTAASHHKRSVFRRIIQLAVCTNPAVPDHCTALAKIIITLSDLSHTGTPNPLCIYIIGTADPAVFL